MKAMRSLHIARYKNSDQSGIYVLSEHVEEEMAKRGISLEHVESALTYGKYKRTRGAKIFAIGKKEVKYFKDLGYDIQEYENTHVVCSNEGAVITSYKNTSMRDMREHKSGKWRRKARRTRKRWKT